MEEEDRRPATEKEIATLLTESSIRLHLTDLLLGRMREAPMGRSDREQSEVLQQIEAALEAYGSFFYSLEHR